MGGVLSDLGKTKEAEILIRKAIDMNSNYADAYLNLGIILKRLGKYNSAISQFRKAIELDNSLSEAKSALIDIQGLICDWSESKLYSSWFNKLGIEGSSVNPGSLLYYEDNPFNQLKRAQKFYKEKFFRKKIK